MARRSPGPHSGPVKSSSKNPTVAKAIVIALDDAIRFIKAKPDVAADIYIKSEASKLNKQDVLDIAERWHHALRHDAKRHHEICELHGAHGTVEVGTEILGGRILPLTQRIGNDVVRAVRYSEVRLCSFLLIPSGWSPNQGGGEPHIEAIRSGFSLAGCHRVGPAYRKAPDDKH